MIDGTALGCIGRCKVCGKAIQLRRATVFTWPDKRIGPSENDAWAHFVTTDHPAELSPGVGEYYDEQIAEQKAEYERECARQLRAGRCPHSGLRLHPHGNAAAVSDLSCDVDNLRPLDHITDEALLFHRDWQMGSVVQEVHTGECCADEEFCDFYPQLWEMAFMAGWTRSGSYYNPEDDSPRLPVRVLWNPAWEEA